MQDKTVNTFREGMDKDTGYSIYPDSRYLHGENLRLISDSTNQNMEITQVPGNEYKFTFPVISGVLYIELSRNLFSAPGAYPYNFYIVRNGVNILITGTATIDSNESFYRQLADKINSFGMLQAAYSKNRLVVTSEGCTSLQFISLTGNTPMVGLDIFAAYRIPDKLKVCGHGIVDDRVYLFTCYEGLSNGQIWRVEDDYTVTLLYYNKLNWSADYKIKALSFHNKDTNSKLYLVDGRNILRHINVGDSNLLAVDPDSFGVVNNVTLSAPQINSLGSGSLKNGVIQYSYQLYKLHGTQTRFSDPSYLINLSDSSINSGDNRNYRGGDIDIVSNKSCIVNIDNIDNSFDYIRVVSLFYDTYNGLPVIKIIDERPIPRNGSVQLEDTGTENYGTYTIEEFNTIGGYVTIPTDIEEKNNILVQGGITEVYDDVDYDARVYRWNNTFGTVQCGLKSNGITEFVSLTVGGSYPTLAETHDCINIDQSIYKYNADSGRLGGSGPNISYHFELLQIVLDSQNTDDRYMYSEKGNQTVSGNTYFMDYSSPINGKVVGYARNETYRFELVIVDDYDRPMYSKWITDMKMPDYDTLDTVNTYTYDYGLTKKDFALTYKKGSVLYGNILYPVFTIKNYPINPVTGLPYKVKIVRSLRENKDKSVVANGIVIKTVVSDGQFYPSSIAASIGQTYSNENYFISPEPVISNKQGSDVKILTNDTVKVFANAEIIPQYPYNTSPWGLSHQSFKIRTIHNVNNNYIVSDCKLLGNIEANTIANTRYINKYRPTSSKHKEGTKNGLSIYAFSYTPQVYCVPMVSIRRTLTNQYGGNTYYDRINNQFVDCFTIQTGSVYKVFGGDTYVCMFDYLNQYLDTDESWGTNNYDFENIYFPVETSFNLNYRTDYSLRTTKGLAAGAPVRLQEFAGFYTDGTESYTQEKDLYLLNTAYIRQNTIRTYYPKPLNFEENKYYPNRLLASSRKQENEEIDSWTQFMPNDFLDLSKKFGSITALKNTKNYFYVLQEKAIGVTSIDERSIITDNNVSELVLGTGGVLVRHDYVNTMSGTSHKWSVQETINGLFYFDAVTKSIEIQGGSVTDVSGMRSFFQQFGKDTVVNSYYDFKNKEYVISMDDYTLSYSMLTKSFQSFL